MTTNQSDLALRFVEKDFKAIDPAEIKDAIMHFASWLQGEEFKRFMVHYRLFSAIYPSLNQIISHQLMLQIRIIPQKQWNLDKVLNLAFSHLFAYPLFCKG